MVWICKIWMCAMYAALSIMCVHMKALKRSSVHTFVQFGMVPHKMFSYKHPPPPPQIRFVHEIFMTHWGINTHSITVHLVNRVQNGMWTWPESLCMPEFNPRGKLADLTAFFWSDGGNSNQLSRAEPVLLGWFLASNLGSHQHLPRNSVGSANFPGG